MDTKDLNRELVEELGFLLWDCDYKIISRKEYPKKKMWGDKITLGQLVEMYK